MHCPLCSGPVHQEDGMFVCDVDHRVNGDTMERYHDARLAEAMWMAIGALDNEAAVLHVLGGDERAHFAREAEEQAHLLRDFARRHAPRVNDDPASEAR